MQITGTRSLIPLRQPTSMRGGQGEQKLVFLYPMFFDNTLAGLQDLLRDFLTVDFMGQIKVANVLNITTSATKVGVVGSGPNAVNPAEEVRRSISDVYHWNMGEQPNYSRPDTRDYQERVHSFLNFIRNQLQHDPRYSELRPIISSILTEENLVQIPLILGTKTWMAKAKSLYLILLVSMTFGDLPLDRESSLDQIEQLINTIPPGSFASLMADRDARERMRKQSTLPGYSGINLSPRVPAAISSKLQRPIAHFTNQDVQKLSGYYTSEATITCRTLKVALNASRWEAATDHLSTNTNRVTQDNIPIIQNRTQRRHFENAMMSFRGYVSSLVVPILHSMEVVLGPTPPDISFDSKVQDFLRNSIDSMTNVYEELSGHVTMQLVDMTKSAQDRVQTALNNIQSVTGLCNANVQLTDDIRKIIEDDLDPKIRLPIRLNGDDVADFGESVSQASNKLRHIAESIETGLANALIDGTQFKHQILTIKDRLQRSAHAFLYGGDDYALFNPAIMRDPAAFADRHANFFDLVCDNNNPDRCANHLNQYCDVIAQAIENLTYFFFIWNFLSFLCNYIQDVEVDIEIQRRDILDFPNYCLVIPVEVVKYLYTINTSRNFKQLLMSSNPASNAELANLGQEDAIVNLNNINRMIEIVNRRLNVPNLIVVDNKSQAVYYKFMYMTKPNRITMQALRDYIRHQKDVLPGF